MENLTEYNRRGFIPGPQESMEAFKKRVDFCLRLKKDFLHEISLPHSINTDPDRAVLKLTEELFGITPDWVPIFFSNWRLAPWHGGAAWIFQLKEDSPQGAILQLRKGFANRDRYLALYEKNELMAHEMAHVGRMAFDEKKYEELLAYRTSKKGFLRYFGPILQSTLESRLVIYLLATLFLMDLFFLIQGSLTAYLDTQIFKLIPLGLILYGLFRLKRRQSTLKQAEERLQPLFSHPQTILYRLTDNEIELFAKSTQAEILRYIEQNQTFRWQVIKANYHRDSESTEMP